MGNCSSSSVKLLLLSVLVSTRCFTGGNLNYSLIKVSDTTVIDSLTRGCHILFNSQTSLAREEFKFLEEIHQLAHPKALSMGVVDFHEFSLGEKFHLVVEDQQGHSIEIGNLPHYDYILLRQRKIDRSCLLKPDHLREKITGVVSSDCAGNRHCFVKLVNRQCRTFYTETGGINSEGLAIENLLASRYSLSGTSITMEKLMEKCGINGSLKSFFYTGYCDTPTNEEVCRSERCESPAIPRCEERSFEDFTQADFIRNFLSVSKPVVIKGAAQRLSYFTQWTKEFLKLKFGQKELHIKLAPRANGTVGEFEGVEHISRWNLGKFAVPDIIRSHLENPELVMVRPASVDMRLEDFFQQIDNPDHLGHNVSAYLEYTSIKDLLGETNEAVEELAYLRGLLKLDFTNVWLSDGNTLGKLHFDEYENLLVQLSGRKQLILFEPYHNLQLYEGHIIEAMLTFRQGKFHREKLIESTAMTMSPLDITAPDFEKFPRSRHLTPLNCTINRGDVLFLPSWWWHEVQSYPDPQDRRNLALNYWYEPFYSKEFPCSECSIELNPAYHHLISQFKFY